MMKRVPRERIHREPRKLRCGKMPFGKNTSEQRKKADALGQ